jgi:glycosyltransferase involved in cell wall biosynthesis
MISIVIPAYNDPEGAYLTAVAAYTQLEQLGECFEIIVVGDGPNPPQPPFPTQIMLVHAGTPQAARHYGIAASSGEYIFCLDAHVVCSQGFFADALALLRKYPKIAAVFPAMAMYKRDSLCYGYGIRWDSDFENSGGFETPIVEELYPVVTVSHGAFGLKRSAYQETGGYSLGQKGTGGEEVFLNTKLWMMGYFCYMLPQHYHWHYIDRGRNTTGKAIRTRPANLCFAAYALGGANYFERVLLAHSPLHGSGVTFGADMRKIADVERVRITSGPFGGDLDKLLAMWKRCGIRA